jgi:hypothetical protein
MLGTLPIVDGQRMALILICKDVAKENQGRKKQALRKQPINKY